MIRLHSSRSALLLAGLTALALSACSSNNEETEIADPKAAEAAPPAAAPRIPKVNAPLTAEQVNINLTLLEQPSYDAASDQLHLRVGLENKGSVVLPGIGTNPVTLGIIQMQDDGTGKATKRGLDTRAPFTSDIEAGQTGQADVVLPAAFVLNHAISLEPLQENVAWFGFNFKQPTLTIGPFVRCSDGKGLCDGQNKPVPAR